MKRFVLVLMMGLLVSATLVAAPLEFPRHPALSPDGSQVAFDWAGDIWLASSEGGAAQRLTVNQAYDHDPKFSPDGKSIAFTSNREGNNDVWIMGTDGSMPRALTFHSASDKVYSFSADGSSVVFVSRRDRRTLSWMPSVYQVSVDGGMPTRVMKGEGSQVSVDGAGNVVHVRGYVAWWRQRYRGSANEEIWSYRPADDSYHRLTNFDGCDRFPQATSSGLIYYVTESDGHFNVFSMNADGTDKTRRTAFTDAGVRFLSVSLDGSKAMIEKDGAFWSMSLPEGEPKKVVFNAAADQHEAPVTWNTYSSKAESAVVSSDGDYAAFVVRGEVFVTETEDDGVTGRITETAWRERDLAWTKAGEELLFISDREGQQDLYRVKSADPKEKRLARTFKVKTERLTKTDQDEWNPKVSPDGKKVLFVRGKGDLVLMDLKTRKERVLLNYYLTPEYTFSPDGKWLAISKEDENFNADIFLLNLEDASAPMVNVSQHPDYDMSPTFSPDGKILAFASKRNGDTMDVWYVFLAQADDLKTADDWKQEKAAKKDEGDDKKDGKDKDDKKKKGVEVVIDLENIHERLHQLTHYSGDENMAAMLNDFTFLFTSDHDGDTDLYSVSLEDTSDITRITKGDKSPSSITLTKDLKSLFYVSGGRIRKVGVDGKKDAGISFSARMDIRHKQERRQMFLEAWRTLGDWFYDPDYHGVDWQKIRSDYLPLAEVAVHREDFLDVVRMVLGELNASHTGAYDRSRSRGSRPTGELGVTWDESYTGMGLKVEKIITGGPAAKTGILGVGEVVLGVNGTSFGSGNPFDLMNGTIGTRTLLKVRGKDGVEREEVVRPISTRAQRSLIYDDWIRERRELVHLKSGGKIGYVHIQGMSMPSLERFERDLYAEAHGKDGLIIDVRYNGGGWTADYLLSILRVKPHAYTISRDGQRGYPQGRLPLSSWSGKMAAMCNEFSFSNAEIFSHAFKNLELGPLIGVQTYGGVISTGGFTLIDGTWIRQPFRGWYTLPAGTNMENNGAIPDLELRNLPGDEWSNMDRQLEAALKELQKTL